MDKEILLGIKYHVKSIGQLGNDEIWRIYKELDKGRANTEYVEHVEILGVQTWSGELAHGIGYSLICKGYLHVDYDPEQGYKFAVIDGDNSYVPKYTKDESGKIIEL